MTQREGPRIVALRGLGAFRHGRRGACPTGTETFPLCRARLQEQGVGDFQNICDVQQGGGDLQRRRPGPPGPAVGQWGRVLRRSLPSRSPTHICQFPQHRRGSRPLLRGCGREASECIQEGEHDVDGSWRGTWGQEQFPTEEARCGVPAMTLTAVRRWELIVTT